MADLSLVNALKTAFSALGAKTSDSNYAVGLFDETTAEPKGIMGMSDLASVLGGLQFKSTPSGGPDNITEMGLYYANISQSDGYPTNGWSSIVVFKLGNNVTVQMIFPTTANGLYFRSNIGSAWKNVTTS